MTDGIADNDFFSIGLVKALRAIAHVDLYEEKFLIKTGLRKYQRAINGLNEL